MIHLALSPAATGDPLERARRHIDANLFEPLSLAGLAGAAGLSAYHFTRQFGARFGVSPMAYVRGRRLAAAAERLCAQRPTPLVELAFDCGFDSQEGFTRAFKRAFGVPPGRFRRAGGQTVPLETLPMSETAIRINLTQAPAPVRKGPLRIVGLSGVFDDANKAAIPLLWERLIGMMPIPGVADFESFGVCAGGPEPGSLRYTAGFPIPAGAPTPAGLELVELAPQTYLVFRQVIDAGPLHPQMQAATKAIWGELVPKSGRRLVHAPDLEFYPADFTPGRAGDWVEWWLPVEV
ncbi:MAG TPA: AraC family transcriptional regulator [Caulobacteraceae bacterium]|jgi:AraC family transcriptional regulator|nr:AraC family transcriptional regulator [Caulobacteraceae bacterium]